MNAKELDKRLKKFQSRLDQEEAKELEKILSDIMGKKKIIKRVKK